MQLDKQESVEDTDKLMDVLAAIEVGDEDGDEDIAEGSNGQLHTYLLGYVWTDGWMAIAKMDIKAVRKSMQERRTGKRRLTKYILRKMNKMRVSAHQFDLSTSTYAPALWREYAHSLRPNVHFD